jgi:hypothetical protein
MDIAVWFLKLRRIMSYELDMLSFAWPDLTMTSTCYTAPCLQDFLKTMRQSETTRSMYTHIPKLLPSQPIAFILGGRHL